ncbi:unnamed protein product, partial [Choristocarpus tenellus]
LLGVAKDATDRDITRAYRKQALKWHPDKNRDEPKKAEERFKHVSEAYEVLSDQEKRKMYDMYGKEGIFAAAGGGGGGGSRGSAGGFPQGFGGHGSEGHFFSFHGGNGEGGGFEGFTDPMDLFESIFGGGMGEGRRSGGGG